MQPSEFDEVFKWRLEVKRRHIITPLRKRVRYLEREEYRNIHAAKEAYALHYTIDVMEQHFKNIERENQNILRMAKERVNEDS